MTPPRYTPPRPIEGAPNGRIDIRSLPELQAHHHWHIVSIQWPAWEPAPILTIEEEPPTGKTVASSNAAAAPILPTQEPLL